MNGIKLLLITFLTFNCVYAQSWEVKISGTVTDMSNNKLTENIPVVLMANRDTIAIQTTDNIGEFLFHITFSVENDYYIFLNIAHQNSIRDWIKLHAKGDTNSIGEYRIDLSKLRIIHDRFDNNAYYEKNETVKYQNFDLDYFKNILTEYPQLCIRFVQTINPEEKKSISKRRKKQFLKILKTAGINMNQIFFSDEIFILDISKLEDKRSRIEGVVYSMDGNCKK